MSELLESSFSIEDIIKTSKSPVRQAELKPEELITQLRKLQQVKKNLEEEVTEVMLLKCARKQEEDALAAEALKLEGTLNEKEELNRSLQLKCEDLQLEAQRQLEQNHQKEELVKQYSFQIQETKLKHRKIRMKFENQLQQLTEQHKNLSAVFAPQRLPAEIQSAEYSTKQLLKAEQQKLEQLAKLLDELNHTQNAEVHMDTSEKAP
ncbi:synaptonemal complex central element protein 1 [Danio aesculapii]|uniref:synaptonemal complex central element protein 1 n=1 Tax=Danio aesculapii TaxID=1142201 RepID=UPI0024C0687C|nr:synaptonemal complex central element protein 1 [Danio aesculapii]